MSSNGATSSLVIAGRLFLLLLAAGAAVAAFALPSGRERGHVPGGVVAGAGAGAPHYVCPMHAEIVSPTPSQCPICRMALEVAREDSAPLEVKVVSAAKRSASTLPVRAPAWIEASGRLAAVLFNDELEGLSPREHALFFRATPPGAAGIAADLTAEAPTPRDRSTSTIHLRIEAGAAVLRPGEVGWVELAARSRTPLVVPVSALLPSSEGPYVLAAAADGRTFSKRRVEIGKVEGGLAALLSGLGEGEPIAVGSTFSLDAERRLREQRERTPRVQR